MSTAIQGTDTPLGSKLGMEVPLVLLLIIQLDVGSLVHSLGNQFFQSKLISETILVATYPWLHSQVQIICQLFLDTDQLPTHSLLPVSCHPTKQFIVAFLKGLPSDEMDPISGS